MATRQEYNKCIAPYMQGTGKTKEQRQLSMCTGAKLCSGKATSPAEAEQICLNQPPKEPKLRKTRGGKIDTGTLAVCVIKSLDGSEPTLANLPPIIARCTGQKAGRTT